MRIIGGQFRGRTLKIPKNLPVRPTTDRAKEGLFNILNNRVDFSELNVLDLFCGTGNISFEFQSRGVAKTTSVDANYRCTSFVQKTMQDLNCKNALVIKSDVIRFLSNTSQKWNLIFADPPYDFEHYHELVLQIMEKQLLSEDGMLIVEHPESVVFKDKPGYVETRKYGRVHFSFFKLKA